MWVNIDEPCADCGKPRREHQRKTNACPVGKKYGQKEHEAFSATAAFRKEDIGLSAPQRKSTIGP